MEKGIAMAKTGCWRERTRKRLDRSGIQGRGFAESEDVAKGIKILFVEEKMAATMRQVKESGPWMVQW